MTVAVKLRKETDMLVLNLRFLLLVLPLSQGLLFSKRPINTEYGSVEIFSQTGFTSRLQCASLCQSWTSTDFICHAFIYKNHSCHLFQIWNEHLTGNTTAYVSAGESNFCDEPSVIGATNFNKMDCNVSHIADCAIKDFRPLWVLKNNQDCLNLHQNVWLGQRWEPNQFILIDLGCTRQVRNVQILNNFCLDASNRTNW